MHPWRVYLVLGVRVYREALRRVLEESGLRIVGEAAIARDLIDEVDHLRPDIALVDTSTAEPAAIWGITAEPSRPKVLAVGLGETADEFIPWAEAGISGYVPRGAPLEDLISSVEGVAAGEARLSPEIGAILLAHVAALAAGRPRRCESADLTAREIQILELVQDGLSNKEIAARLQIELPTVKNHMHNILAKLGVHSRAQAAARARRSP
jgi:two-component system nitrate/nitrite response regulator NarL